MEGMIYAITNEQGAILCEPMFIPWEELWIIKRTFLCTVQYGQIIFHS